MTLLYSLKKHRTDHGAVYYTTIPVYAEKYEDIPPVDATNSPPPTEMAAITFKTSSLTEPTPEGIFPKKALEGMQAERLSLGERKHADYAGAGDPILTSGLEGVVIRLTDKIFRLRSLIKKGKTPQIEESLEDTLKDIGNYADYGVLLYRNKWPGQSGQKPTDSV